MVTGANSLSLVRDELFATIAEAEQSLEHFIVDRNNGSLLQQAVESFHQVRGTLNLIELVGAELLAQEMLTLATDIPVAAGEDRDAQLSALNNALYILRHYLESVDASRQEIPELLLSGINGLRKVSDQAPLAESFFFSVRLDLPRPTTAAASVESLEAESRRLRHMYQAGLLGLLRGQRVPASLKFMSRALSRLDALYANTAGGRLCWIGAAALEAHADGQLLLRPSRKQLYARLDRELRLMFTSAEYQAPRAMLKELLYFIALADSRGPLASEVRDTFSLSSLPFTDHLLEEESQRLAGPGQAVMRSLSTAIQEELAGIKDLLDLIERGAAEEKALYNLHSLLGKLAKTLGMVGLPSAANALHGQLSVVSSWSEQSKPALAELQKLADVVLYVEGVVPSLASNDRRRMKLPSERAESPEMTFAQHQLNEARIVVLDEAAAGLALAKRAITAYIESNGDKLHLANVPFTLQAVRGGLWFLGQERMASLINACAGYIQQQMIETTQVPSQQMLETLADALTSLEYYLEGGNRLEMGGSGSEVLDLATESVRALGVPAAA
ncbi:ferrous iron transporter B [Stutzerimonas tarimensis]|uniref:Ferrous iron transporter B n=1 Tax=Stutzerimonas tarimensis TaxID=1507735 RepID=A0ABV7T4V0_9GAMM